MPEATWTIDLAESGATVAINALLIASGDSGRDGIFTRP